MLRSLKLAPTERFMPRPRRGDDVESDRAWTVDRPTPEGERRVSPNRNGSQSIVFSDHKYQGYYAFPGRDLVRLVREGEGATVIIGRCVEIPAFVEACQNLLPLTPVVPIRLDVPLQILASRLARRGEAYPGELHERISLLEGMHRDDRPQLEALTAVYGLTSLLSITKDEIRRFGYHREQIKDLNSEVSSLLLKEAIEHARKQAGTLAKDLLRERTIHYKHPYIPDALIDVLDNKLLPAAEKLGLKLALQAGLAVGIYLEEARPISLDIDFTLCQTKKSGANLQALAKEITGKDLPVKATWDKQVYHAEGVFSGAMSDKFQEHVELDGLVVTRLQSRNEGFCFEFGLDGLEYFHRRTVNLPSGRQIALIPPERIVLEKLAAGRGPEIHKFDLFDAAGLLAKLPVNPSLVRKMLESQRYMPEIDRDIAPMLANEVKLGTAGLLDALHIDHPKLREIALSMGGAITLPLDHALPSPDKNLTLDGLKKLALIHSVDRSLTRIAESLDEEWKIGERTTTIAQHFGREAVLAGVEGLRQQLLYFAEFELGRNDIYVRRPSNASGYRAAFFSQLEAQRARLGFSS